VVCAGSLARLRQFFSGPSDSNKGSKGKEETTSGSFRAVSEVISDETNLSLSKLCLISHRRKLTWFDPTRLLSEVIEPICFNYSSQNFTQK
jgi:hypothetical protein